MLEDKKWQQYALCAVAVHRKRREDGPTIASARKSSIARIESFDPRAAPMLHCMCETCSAVPQTSSQVLAASAGNILEAFREDLKRLSVCPVSITSSLALFEST